MPRSSNAEVSASYTKPKPGGDGSASSSVVNNTSVLSRVLQLDEVQLVDGVERGRQTGRQGMLPVTVTVKRCIGGWLRKNPPRVA